ncbi:unnamed protein product [Euphydryas editha]|nr:unnamed protein product [Euphydryas editha]
MAHIPKEKRTKFDRKAKKHILVGFSDDIKGNRIYDPVKKQVITSRDVVILEKTEKEKTATVFIESTNSMGEGMEESIVKLELLDKSNSSESEYVNCKKDQNLKEETRHVQEEQQTVNKREARITRKSERYGYANACTTSIGDHGMTYAEAISGPENQQWLQAMAAELQSFKDNQVWEVVDTSDNVSVVQCKWVLKKKHDCDNNVTYRARLVAKGFTQKPGVDYQETFSPVIRHSTLRLLFPLSVQYGMDITYLDVATAFLNSRLKENIFMHIPEGLTVKGQVKHYLGMRININKSKDVITVDQEHYIEELINKFDMSDCNTADTPIECKLNIEKSDICEDGLPYQKLIGSLMYLAVLTRPDIAFSVSYLSQFNNCYSYTHWNYAKKENFKIFIYKTKKYCLKYCKEKAELEGYVDADWASDTTDRRSYTGYCFIKSESAISWESKKQRTVALSSCEAEYMAMSEACREAIYLRNLEIESKGFCNRIVLYSDSQSALKLANNHQSHKRSKHIDVRYNFIRDVINNDIIETKYLPTASMPADLLTKGLPSIKHYRFMKAIGMVKN